MNIYKLNRLIVIEKRTTSMDVIGNEISEWKTYYKCWATISTLSGLERRQDGQLLPQENLTYIVRECDKTKQLNAEDYRIIHDGVMYNVRFVDKNNIERGYVKIDVERAVNGKKD